MTDPLKILGDLQRNWERDTTAETPGPGAFYKESRVTSVAALYTVLASDHIVLANGTFTVNLPAATGSYAIYVIINDGAGVITVDGDGAETINGAATYVLAAGDAITILDSGAGTWRIF